MSAAPYTRFELLRTFRNRRFFIFSLGFPLVLYFLIATPNRNEDDLGGSGISAPLYFMVGLAAFGTMNAMLAGGGRSRPSARSAGTASCGSPRCRRARTSARRSLTGYLMALVTIVLLVRGRRRRSASALSAGEWLADDGAAPARAVPFAALGILLGHLLTSDSIGPAIGGLTALLALLGGTWFPPATGCYARLAQVLPSYWLVQASHVALGGGGWGVRGLVVIVGAWSVVPGPGRRPRVPARHAALLEHALVGLRAPAEDPEHATEQRLRPRLALLAGLEPSLAVRHDAVLLHALSLRPPGR